VGWLRRAALQGHTEAEYQLGVMYLEGRGVAQDFDEALGWFVRAARKGHPQAMQVVRRVQEGVRK
jgi:TPR repeat protein